MSVAAASEVRVIVELWQYAFGPRAPLVAHRGRLTRDDGIKGHTRTIDCVSPHRSVCGTLHM
mgnify:FL=1